MKFNLKTLIELVLAIHGIGMIGGIYFVFAKESWFSRALGNEKLAAYLAAAIWLVAGVALVATAWALFKDLAWWKTAGAVAAVANVAGIALWYDAVPGGAIFGTVASVLGIIYLYIKG